MHLNDSFKFNILVKHFILTFLYNLALFICHLFINAHFHRGHILCDPEVFYVYFLAKIDSIRPVRIPWQTTDISRSFLQPLHKKPQNDYTLQLISQREN